MSDQPIGFFDSGFGGLTVLREVVRLLPSENLIYLGDTAHLPYGNKSPEAILEYSRENAAFLLQFGIKMLIIPCHTACSQALETLQKELPIPVLGVIEPGLKLLKHKQKVAVLGTTRTIESGIYQTEISKRFPKTQVFAQACPLFVPLIEEGYKDHCAAQSIASAYLSPLIGKIDAALLACTHYPLLKPALAAVLGPEVELIEPALRCAADAKEQLQSTGRLNSQSSPGKIRFFASDDPDKFARHAKDFLQNKIEKVEKK